jgi:hypothetical protein
MTGRNNVKSFQFETYVLRYGFDPSKLKVRKSVLLIFSNFRAGGVAQVIRVPAQYCRKKKSIFSNFCNKKRKYIGSSFPPPPIPF